MRRLFLLAGTLLGVCVTYVVLHLALIEVGQEIVVLERWTGEGTQRSARLWIVDDGERSWLHHGYADSPWIRHLAVDPVVTVERGGENQRYRAQPDPDADPEVHRLLREKYGFADRLVRFWAGTDTETGFATRETCQAIPVRLDAL